MNSNNIKRIEGNVDEQMKKINDYQEKLRDKKEVLSFLSDCFKIASEVEKSDNYVLVEFNSYFNKIYYGRKNSCFESDIVYSRRIRKMKRLVCEYIGLKYYDFEQTEEHGRNVTVLVSEQVCIPYKYLDDEFNLDLDKDINKVLSIKPILF